MGTYASTKIGIYLLEPYGSKEQKTTFYVHPETRNKMKSKFCPDTGVEGVKKTNVKTIKVYPSPWSVEGLDEDLFFAPDYHGAKEGYLTYLYNFDDDHYSKTYDNEGAFNVNLSLFNNADEVIKEFVYEYGDQIKLIEETYGEVKVRFGVVHYFM